MTATTAIPCNPDDPRSRIEALASLAEALSRHAGTDPAEACMSLMTAAAKLALEHGAEPEWWVGVVSETGARDAIDAARHWWPGPPAGEAVH